MQDFELGQLAENLIAARRERELSQVVLAAKAKLTRQHLTYFEKGLRVPSVSQLVRLARALDLPLQRLLFGRNGLGAEPRDIAIELRHLGLIDLWVANPVVPGAFRRPEEVVIRAIAGRAPEARIVEGIPAVLAWNRWSHFLLWAFARAIGRASVYRLAWLCDIVLTIERVGGFPGGCCAKEDLASFLRRVKKSPPQGWDDLGRPADRPPTLAVWKRWRISYPADLDTFRQRAETLVSLAKAERYKLPIWRAS